jgi:hypothetical protein
MERGELCHDRCTGLLLAEYMQDGGAARPNAKMLCTGSVLNCGFGDFGIGGFMLELSIKVTVNHL